METRPPVYADATALIGLARINRLDLLMLFRLPVYVTAVVWAEATAGPERPGVPALFAARAAGVLEVVEEGDADAYPQLDGGESTVLSAAAAAGAAVLLDERRARAVIAATPDLQRALPYITGFAGLLLLAKQRGTITVVKPLLDELLREQFRISPGLYDAVLRQAQEHQ